jgi:hypothetical protein
MSLRAQRNQQMKQWCFEAFVKTANATKAKEEEEELEEELEEALQETYEWHKYHKLQPGDKVRCKNQTVKNADRVLTVATVNCDTVTFSKSGRSARLGNFGITYHLCDRLLNKKTQEIEWVVYTLVRNGTKCYILSNNQAVREGNKQYTKVAPTAAQIAAYKAKEQADQDDREYYLYVPTQEQQQAYMAMMREKDLDFKHFQYDLEYDDDSDDDDDDDDDE